MSVTGWWAEIHGAAARTVTATISGAGAVGTVSGHTGASATITGAGDVAIFGTSTFTTTATLRGAAGFDVAAAPTFTTTITGAGTVGVITGDRTASATITGAGTVGKVGAGSFTATATRTGASVLDVPISFVNANQAAATTVTTATHAAGDLLVITSWGIFSTIPSLGSGFTTPSGGTNSGSGVGWRCGSRIATSTNDSSGTWTNANNVQNINYRGASGLGAVAFNSGTSATIVYPALTLQQPGTSWVLRVGWHIGASNLNSTTLTGYTRRQTLSPGSGQVVTWGSNGTVASNPTADSQSANSSSTWQSCSIEILT